MDVVGRVPDGPPDLDETKLDSAGAAPDSKGRLWNLKQCGDLLRGQQCRWI